MAMILALLLDFGSPKSPVMADWFGVHEMTIKRWRRDRSGPPHINAGLRAVRDRKGDVVAWLRDRAVRYDKVEG